MQRESEEREYRQVGGNLRNITAASRIQSVIATLEDIKSKSSDYAKVIDEAIEVLGGAA